MCNQSQTEDHRVTTNERAPRAQPARPHPVGPRAGPDEAFAAPADLSGQCLGARYRLLRPLGKRVSLYQARYRSHGEHMLIRVFPGAASDETVQRFMAQARAASLLHHGHVVHVTDFGVDTLANGARVAYMAMENLKSESLTVTLAKHGPLHWTRVLAIARQICRALIVAHDRGVVHGNLGAANCLRIPRHGTPDFIKLVDFGVTAGHDGRASATEARRADDVHALGVLMYRLLTNHMPGSSPTLSAAFVGLDMPPAFASVIGDILRCDPRARPSSARALYRALVAAEPIPLPSAPPCQDEPASVGAHAPCPAVTPAPAEPMASAHALAAASEPRGAVTRPAERAEGPFHPGLGAALTVLPELPDHGWYGSLCPAWAIWATLALMAMRAVESLLQAP